MTDELLDIKTASIEGSYAFIHGEPISSNPYRRGEYWLHREWDRAWKREQEIADEGKLTQASAA